MTSAEIRRDLSGTVRSRFTSVEPKLELSSRFEGMPLFLTRSLRCSRYSAIRRDSGYDFISFTSWYGRISTVEAAANRTVGQVNQYLQSLQGSAEQLKGEIQQLVNSLIQKRKQERGTHSQIVAGLKIPVRQAPTTETPVTEPTRSNTPDKNDEWDVFISHASEDKSEIARPLAEALRAKGLRVW